MKDYKRILLIDDVLATGGSAVAALNLLQKAGAKVEHIFVVIELVELGGRELLENAFKEDDKNAQQNEPCPTTKSKLTSLLRY
jgi:adenine/guanine phosphoribosyltransferase-like PRPP-binding protein